MLKHLLEEVFVCAPEGRFDTLFVIKSRQVHWNHVTRSSFGWELPPKLEGRHGLARVSTCTYVCNPLLVALKA